MNASVALGFVLTMVAGLLAGNCMLPAKFARTWNWENLWSVFSVVSLVVLPWTLALLFVAHLLDVYRTLGTSQLAVPFLFGAGWGVAQILFGISVKRLGLGLGYAIIVGLGAVMGTLVPFFAQQRGMVDRQALAFVIVGVIVMIGGIMLVTAGGQLRETSLQGDAGVSIKAQGFAAAVAMAVLCGFMAPMLNYAFAFGSGIAQAAITLGNTKAASAYAVWPVALAGGFLPNAAYSAFLLVRNKSIPLFGRSLRDGVAGVLMGILWMGAFAIYGVSAAYLGTLGTSIGWGLFQIFMIMAATLAGVLTGEWKQAPQRARRLLAGGLLTLALATAFLAVSNRV